MALSKKNTYSHSSLLRDVRPLSQKFYDAMVTAPVAAMILGCSGVGILLHEYVTVASDFLFIFGVLYCWWLFKKPRVLPAKLPKYAPYMDPHNNAPGSSAPGKPDGILYLGNTKANNEEIWFSNSDARTHILYLGTTGSGKTEGLKSIVTNALCWASGYIYIDGKADTDLWSALTAMARRFGRDDDLLVLNYMTGNRDGKAPSNTMNPFSAGSSSYLTNLLVSLMPDAGGDNAMWKDRAVSLMSVLMPAMTWKRDNQDMRLNVGTVREYLNFPRIIQLARDPDVPAKIRVGIQGYLDTLPGYVDDVFDDDGNEKPMSPDAPMVDTSVVRQQHGYLSMQFTRSLQSLADDYGYIFDSEAADIDMMDVVLNRRMLVALIPALEKSGDEAANLGKIVAATLKGMMGATLGSEVEGESSTVIDNKPTRSATPFIAVFDEVGYYTAQGMAVMAAQARSLGFCLVYAAQDLPALEKRVKEEARSITANCNIKIFGKLEDPTQTKEFFEKTVGKAFVAEVSGFSIGQNSMTTSYSDRREAGIQLREKADYGELRTYREGDAIVTFGETLEHVGFFYSNPGMAKSMRVQKMLALPKVDEVRLKQRKLVRTFLERYRQKGWTAEKAGDPIEAKEEFSRLLQGFKIGHDAEYSMSESGAMAVSNLAEMFIDENSDEFKMEREFIEQEINAAQEGSTKEQIALRALDEIESSGALDDKNEDENDSLSWADLLGLGGGGDAAGGGDDDSDADANFNSEPDIVDLEAIRQFRATENKEDSKDSDESENDAGEFSWANIMGTSDDSDDGFEDADIEAEIAETSFMPASAAKKSARGDDDFKIEEAMHKAEQGDDIDLPDGLDDDLEDILKSAADSIRSGLLENTDNVSGGDDERKD